MAGQEAEGERGVLGSRWLDIASGGAGLVAVAWRYWAVFAHPIVGTTDFTQIYMAGLAWRLGVPPYAVVHSPALAAAGLNTAPFGAYFYTPLCGVLAAPISMLPYSAACILWSAASWSVLLAGLWCFSGHALPNWRSVWRLALLGATALASGVRWPLVQLQPSLLVVGLLLWFACAVIDGRWTAAFVCSLVISVKPSFFVPVLVLLVFRSRWRMLAGLAAAIILLNGLSSLRTGAYATWRDYRLALARVDQVNDPRALEALTPHLRDQPNSPLARDARWERRNLTWVDPRIDIECIVTAWLPYRAAAKAGAAIFGALVLVLLGLAWVQSDRAGLRQDGGFQTALFAASMAGNLLLLYHQRYDAAALIPATCVALSAIGRRRTDASGWLALLASVCFAYLLTSKIVQGWLRLVVVPTGLLVLVPLCGYLTLATFIGTCAIVRNTLARSTIAPGTHRPEP